MPSIAVLAPTTRDCGARITAACEQITTDPEGVCPACADQLDGFLTVDDGAPF